MTAAWALYRCDRCFACACAWEGFVQIFWEPRAIEVVADESLFWYGRRGIGHGFSFSFWRVDTRDMYVKKLNMRRERWEIGGKLTGLVIGDLGFHESFMKP
jgi:hypothetical protein